MVDDSKQVVQYLEELAQTLTELQVTTQFHILITGGAYMLLQQKRCSTLDIDFAIIKRPRKMQMISRPLLVICIYERERKRRL